MAELYVSKEVSREIAAEVIDTVREQLSGLAWICYSQNELQKRSFMPTGSGSEVLREGWECADARPEGKADTDYWLGPPVVRLETHGGVYILSVFDYSKRTDEDLAKSLEPDGVPAFKEATLKARDLFKDLPEACGRNFPKRSEE
ncbi:hypothetical protein KY361_04660 [Candidatus Woesearchaeota archaeon]|nr:hypothetical protein [Candidatus Woesearchaeota archaeon]